MGGLVVLRATADENIVHGIFLIVSPSPPPLTSGASIRRPAPLFPSDAGQQRRIPRPHQLRDRAAFAGRAEIRDGLQHNLRLLAVVSLRRRFRGEKTRRKRWGVVGR